MAKFMILQTVKIGRWVTLEAASAKEARARFDAGAVVETNKGPYLSFDGSGMGDGEWMEESQISPVRTSTPTLLKGATDEEVDKEAIGLVREKMSFEDYRALGSASSNSPKLLKTTSDLQKAAAESDQAEGRLLETISALGALERDLAATS